MAIPSSCRGRRTIGVCVRKVWGFFFVCPPQFGEEQFVLNFSRDASYLGQIEFAGFKSRMCYRGQSGDRPGENGGKSTMNQNGL